MRWLLNSAVLAAGEYGTYEYSAATEEDVRAFLREPGWVSRIGYPETAAYLRAVSDVEVPLSREASPLAVGDVALVARLRYRVDPAAKGSHRPARDAWELAWIRRTL